MPGFLGSLVFVALGVYLIIISSVFTGLFFNFFSIFSVVWGIITILFFGIGAVFYVYKLFDKKAGLTINEEGIIDNSSGISVGLVRWSDIEKLKVTRVLFIRFLTFTVKNPQDYIAKAGNPFKRKMMEMNYKSYGTPIHISAGSLQVRFKKLHNLLTEKMDEYKQQSNNE